MAKKKNQPTRTKLEEINDSLSGIEQKFEKHKKVIYWIVGSILVIAAGFWAYYNWVHKNQVEKAKTELVAADQLLSKGPQATAQDSANALKIYEKVAKKYGNNFLFKNGYGNRAKLMAGGILYALAAKSDNDQEKIKKYKEALKYVEDYSPKGEIVGPSSQSLLGDIYVNLGDNDKAIKAYDKAIELAGDNRGAVPYFMVKKANVLHFMKKYDEEIKILEEIETKYEGPGSMSMQIERAKAMSGK